MNYKVWTGMNGRYFETLAEANDFAQRYFYRFGVMLLITKENAASEAA